MKKNRVLVGLAIFFALMFIIFGILTAVSIRGTNSFQFNHNYELSTHTEEISLDGINRIEIETTAVDIDVINEGEKVVANFDEFVPVDGSKEFRFEVVGETLYIETSEPENFLFFSINFFQSEDTKLSVLIPEEFDGDVVVSTVSGDTDINLKDNSYLRAGSVSGNIDIVCNAKDGFKIKTVSGDITLSCTQNSGAVSVETVSGNAELNYQHPLSTAIKTVSGNGSVNIKNLNDGDVNIDFSSLSGTLDTDVQKSGDINISFNSVSGNFSLFGIE